MSGVLAEIGEVDKLIAIISAHAVRGAEPDESVSILDDVVHGIARQAVLSRESFPVQFDAAESLQRHQPKADNSYYI